MVFRPELAPFRLPISFDSSNRHRRGTLRTRTGYSCNKCLQPRSFRMVAPWICSTIPLSPRCLRKLRGAGFEPKSRGGCFAGQLGVGWARLFVPILLLITSDSLVTFLYVRALDPLYGSVPIDLYIDKVVWAATIIGAFGPGRCTSGVCLQA